MVSPNCQVETAVRNSSVYWTGIIRQKQGVRQNEGPKYGTLATHGSNFVCRLGVRCNLRRRGGPRLLLKKKKRGGQVSAVRQADGSQAPLSHS